MMVLDNILNKDLKQKAYSLKDIGVNEYAWKVEDVESVLELLMKKNIAILGGDVLKFDETNTPSYTYDNWSTLQNDGESRTDFIVRSHKEAMQYVIKNNQKNKGNIYVVSPEYEKMISIDYNKT